MSRAGDPFDTYLLRVLCTVLSERSVSRTAIKLNQSQPAISVALKRLRAIFHDPLLVREKGGMVPTERALAEGGLDIVIGNWPEPPGQLHLSPLLDDELVCVMAEMNPLSRNGMTVDQYLAAPHIVPMPYSPSHRGVVDTHLAAMRVARNVRVVLPFFSMAPHLLPGTDLLFTTTRHFAEHYAKFLPLAIASTPVAFPRMRFYQLWHDRTHHSAGHRWFRGLLTATGERLWKRKGEKS